MSNHEGFIYLMRSATDNSFYFGSTNDIHRRMREHNEGKSVSTRKRKPWNLVVAIKFAQIAHARKLEHMLKRHKEKVSLSWFMEAVARYQRGFE